MALNQYNGVAPAIGDQLQLIRAMAIKINQLLLGKINIAVEFEAAVGTSTDVNDARITPNSVFIIEPTSSDGAVELAAGTMFVAAADRGDKTCTVTHSTNAATETFRLIIIS